jgi:SpoIIAA-like
VYLLGPRMRKYEADAFGEEARFVARHPSAYERVAVVTDEYWLRPTLGLLSVLARRQIRGFPVSAMEAAKSWVAEGLEERGTPVTTPSGSPQE